MLWALLSIACFMAYRWIRRALKRAIDICDAEAAACRAKLDEMDREERRERLARLPRDPFPRPGGPATKSAVH